MMNFRISIAIFSVALILILRLVWRDPVVSWTTLIACILAAVVGFFVAPFIDKYIRFRRSPK